MLSVKRDAVLGASFQVLLVLVFSSVCVSAGVLEARETAASPISITPSQDWDGNDGPWSSFAVQIGTPPQSVKVLVGTSSTQTWAVATEGCVSGDPKTCGESRGNLWNRNDSITYVPNTANLSTDIYELGLGSNLGYTGKGRYGFDTIQLGWQGSGGPTLKNQTVAGIATKSFFMGMFGLVPRPSKFASDDNTVPSYMENLRNESIIPSLSWAYTAGNQYRLNKVLGSLTLGGYDTSKFVPNNVTFAFDEDEKDLTVQLQKITTNDGTSLLPSPIGALLDSIVPYIYLPVEACELFEKEFGLTWNETSQLYLVDDIQHTLLQAKNPNVTFSIGSNTETVDITFPYAAFDLTASYPLAENPTKYFPLRRAANDTQYTLGRAFFQEAYVIADYDRRNFSVSQCTWDPRATQNLVAILAPGTDTSKSVKLSTGAIAGIAVGGAFITGLIVLYIFWFRPRRQRQKTSELDSNPLYHPVQPQETYIKAELDAGGINQKPDIYVSSPLGHRGGPIEMGESDPVYEMPAREEVALEMEDLVPAGEMEGEKRRSKLWSKKRSRQMTTDSMGFPTSPGSRSVSSAASSLRVSPGSRETPIISPASPDNTRRF